MSSDLKEWLHSLGLYTDGEVLHNPDRSVLLTAALLNSEGDLSHNGALVVNTTPYTGRSPNDKYIVKFEDQQNLWWGKVNKAISPKDFTTLRNRVIAYLNHKNLYITDCFVGADPAYQYSVRVVSEFAWQALASQHLFIYDGTKHHSDPDMIVFAAPDFQTTPGIDPVESKAAICIDLRHKVIVIAGSKYAGEIKKSVFTIMNGVLPEKNVLPMHCSANVGEKGDVALYFGLSGTGKTTLSSTKERRLVGDDEHGWGENGIFNFEGGCYAKTIRLKPDLEPVIWRAANQFATVLENVWLDPELRAPDFDDNRYTENTRAAYDLDLVENIVSGGTTGHPENLFFLTADAFGVMPPIAKLSTEDAIFYFLSGYTSKVAGTERGLSKQPQATFSTCFGEPFWPLTPNIYADLLREKITRYHSHVWLINTGWTAGGYHDGYRMPLPYTRQMVNWVLTSNHLEAKFYTDPYFELQVPVSIPGIPDKLLFPQKTWDDQAAFKRVAEKLRTDFSENFNQFEAYL